MKKIFIKVLWDDPIFVQTEQNKIKQLKNLQNQKRWGVQSALYSVHSPYDSDITSNTFSLYHPDKNKCELLIIALIQMPQSL